MNKITNSKKKEIAEDLFMSSNLTGKSIAEQLIISENTLSKWRREGRWEERKQELQVSPLKIKELLLKEASKIANGEKTTIEADKLSKIVSAIDRLDKRISIRIVVDVLVELDNWLAKVDPEKAVESTKHHKQFILHRIKMES